jgi:hypothetical protein
VCIEDITRSKRVLEDMTGAAVIGYRSPTWTASLADEWLWDHLLSLGFQYDSSLFPFRTHLYGSNANPVRPFRLRPQLVEIPPSVWARAGVRLPYGGGFYFRIYPGWLTRWFVESDLSIDKVPIVYLHPFDVGGRPETHLNRRRNTARGRAGAERLPRGSYETRTLGSL